MTELSLIRDALNVGPEDQSLWYYHQFLVLNILDRQPGGSITPNLPQGQRAQYVLREILDIRALLEDYDDIKWIYEVLVEYTIALTEFEGRKLSPAERQDLSGWIAQLRRLDPMRSGRWADLAREKVLDP
jgi:geranylgeranyl transferase type-2 subunit alpha